MCISRQYTRDGQDAFAGLKFVPRTSRIVNPNGSVVFEMKDVMVPEGWSQVAVDILAQKYFRRAGVPARLRRVAEDGVPEWLQRSACRPPGRTLGGETDSRQVFRRLAGCWTYWGWKGGYFSSRGRRPGVLRRSRATCWRRRWRRRTARSGSTPGCTGRTASRARRRDTTSSTPQRADGAEHQRLRAAGPACLLHPVGQRRPGERRRDHGPVGPRGPHLQVRLRHRARNFSALRGEGEPLSGGGKSSGLMSFLKIGDRAAGAIKSGRDHPPRRQDGRPRPRPPGHRRVRQLEGGRGAEGRGPGQGSKLLNKHLNAILKAIHDAGPNADEKFNPKQNAELRKAILEARHALVPENYIARVIQLAKQGFTSLDVEEYDTDWNSKAYYTVSGQNSNNSVRITNEFMKAAHEDGDWNLYWRTEKEKAKKEAATRSRRGPSRPASCGTRSRSRPGAAPTPACSSTRPSTSGTRARPTGGSMPVTRASQVTLSSPPLKGGSASMNSLKRSSRWSA